MFESHKIGAQNDLFVSSKNNDKSFSTNYGTHGVSFNNLLKNVLEMVAGNVFWKEGHLLKKVKAI